jgi:ABC-2 type transport system ATP-binding protein
LHVRANLGVQLQATSFQPELSIVEILKLYAGIHGVEMNDEKLKAILANIKLEDAVQNVLDNFRAGNSNVFHW